MIKFTAKKNELINKFIESKEELNNLVDCYSSPCNILFPTIIDENINNFNSVFKKHNIVGKIYYAHKCNKSESLIKRMLLNNINLDVASLNELKSGISNGFSGVNIEATGPKNDDFIILGLRHNITFNIDNLTELKKIVYFTKKINKTTKTNVLLRLNDFNSEETKIVNRKSRFGTSRSKIQVLIDYIKENETLFNLIGISFHLDTVNIKEKVVAIENCIGIFQELYVRGFNPYVIDIGGGFKVNYIETKEEWNNSITNLKESILNSSESLTWNNTSFGLRQEKGVLKGSLNIYNYFEEVVGYKFLEEILSAKLNKYQGRTIGEILSDNMIELYIEPGKSLLDGVGLNVAKVNYIKHTANDDILVGLDMKKSDLLIGDQEMFVDPILINNSEKEPSNEGVYFIGNLCMENDFIFKHKVFLDCIPKEGDLVIFINTAGYFMDFEQSNTIQQKIAKKIIAIQNGSAFKYFLDENYEPLKY